MEEQRGQNAGVEEQVAEHGQQQAAGEPESPDAGSAEIGPGGESHAAAGELDGVRELILKAYPDAVAELVGGDSVDALLASVPAARAAYAQVAAAIQASTPTPTPIPTGSGRRPPIDPEGLSPEAKIRVGIREQGSGIR